MRGWVYVITNKCMPGLVKVGYSMKDPELRASELRHTGAPHPYIVDYEVLVEEPRDIERRAHDCLRDRREGKEWFRCSVEEAVVAVKSIVGSGAQVEDFKHASRAKAEAIIQRKQAEERAKRAAEEEHQRREAALRERKLEAERAALAEANEVNWKLFKAKVKGCKKKLITALVILYGYFAWYAYSIGDPIGPLVVIVFAPLFLYVSHLICHSMNYPSNK